MEPTDELLSAFLDDELSDAERRLVEQRLETDDVYRRRYDDYLALREAVQKLPRHRLDDDFAKRIVNVIETRRATQESATAERSPDVSKPTPRRLLVRILPWALASLAAGVVFALFIPALQGPTTGLATRSTVSDDDQPIPRVSASMDDKSDFGIAASEPESLVEENVVVDAEKFSDAYSTESFFKREADRPEALGAVGAEGKEGQIRQKASGLDRVGRSFGIDEIADKISESSGNLSRDQYDYVVTATNVDDFQLRAALERQGIVSIDTSINSKRDNKSTTSLTSPSLASPDKRHAPISGETISAPRQAAAASKAAPAPSRGVGGRDDGDLRQKSGDRFRRARVPGAVEQDTATLAPEQAREPEQYVVVEASRQRILALLRDLNQSGLRIESASGKTAGTTWAIPDVSAGGFWYELADEGSPEPERKGRGEQRQLAASDSAPAPDAAAVDGRTAKSTPRLFEQRKALKKNGTNSDSDLDANQIPEPDPQVQRQARRFAAPSNEPAQQRLFRAEAVEENLGRITGDAETPLRVLFVVRTSNSSETLEQSSSEEPARP